MPVMDGAQLIKAMADHPDLKGVPVFLMSSAPEAALRDKCSGYALFIRKPFEIYGVIDLVTRALNPPRTA
jgi:CheY-like chemotaxis protein